MGKRVICYPLKPKGGSKWDNNELRLSLRSLEKHFKGEYDDVVILGARMPDWVNEENVRFKLAPRYVQALHEAVDVAGPGGDILWMNDDILFLKDTTWEDMVRPVRRQKAGQMSLDAAKRWAQSDNGWQRRLGKIMIELHNRGLTTWKFSTHTPYWYESDRLKVCLDQFAALGYKVAIENAYYNIYAEEFGSAHVGDKFRTERKEARFPMARYPEVRFINLTPNVGAWMRGFLLATYPLPSRFEK